MKAPVTSRLALLVAVAWTGTTVVAHAQTDAADETAVLVQNARVVTPSGELLEGERDVLVLFDGRTEVGADGAFDGRADIETSYEMDDLWVTPGLFVPFSHVGLVDISAERATNDTRAEEAVNSVALRAADGFNPMAVAIGNSRVEGISHIATAPGASGNIFAGTGAIVDTSGAFDSILDEDAFVYVRLGEGGKGSAGGSRLAAAAQLREAFADATDATARTDSDLRVLTRRDARQLRRALEGEMPLVVAANRAVDLLRIAELRQDYPRLDLIILGAREAWQVADRLAASGVKVMIDPHDNLPDNFESVGARLDNAQRLRDAGVEFAFTTASADLTHNVRVLAQHAGNAVGEGLDWEEAFAAVSTTPARWYGVELDSTVVWQGDPLEVTSRPLGMTSGGREIVLESRQTELSRRYDPRLNSDRAHKYR